VDVFVVADPPLEMALVFIVSKLLDDFKKGEILLVVGFLLKVVGETLVDETGIANVNVGDTKNKRSDNKKAFRDG